MRIIRVFAFSCLFFGSHSIFSDQPRIVVMDFEAAEGMSSTLAGHVSELVRTSVVETKRFVVVDRKSMVQVLKEQTLQQSGVCSAESCLVKVGQLLAANKMLTGTIIKLGKNYVLDAKVIDVEKGSVDLAIKVNVKGLDDMQDGVDDLTQRIVAQFFPVDPARDPFRRGLHSAILPGWGQFEKGQFFRGAAFTGASVFLLGMAFAKVKAHDSARSEYRQHQQVADLAAVISPGNPSTGNVLGIWAFSLSERTRTQANVSASQFNTSAGLLLGIWIWCALDAGLAAWPSDSRPTTSVSLGFADSRSATIQFTVTY